MVRAEMLALRRDVAAVLANLFVALSRSPEEARRLVERKPTASEPDLLAESEFIRVETLRGEFLDLRRDVAIVMANLLMADGRSHEEARQIVIDALKPKTDDCARS